MKKYLLGSITILSTTFAYGAVASPVKLTIEVGEYGDKKSVTATQGVSKFDPKQIEELAKETAHPECAMSYMQGLAKALERVDLVREQEVLRNRYSIEGIGVTYDIGFSDTDWIDDDDIVRQFTWNRTITDLGREKPILWNMGRGLPKPTEQFSETKPVNPNDCSIDPKILSKDIKNTIWRDAPTSVFRSDAEFYDQMDPDFVKQMPGKTYTLKGPTGRTLKSKDKSVSDDVLVAVQDGVLSITVDSVSDGVVRGTLHVPRFTPDDVYFFIVGKYDDQDYIDRTLNEVHIGDFSNSAVKLKEIGALIE